MENCLTPPVGKNRQTDVGKNTCEESPTGYTLICHTLSFSEWMSEEEMPHPWTTASLPASIPCETTSCLLQNGQDSQANRGCGSGVRIVLLASELCAIHVHLQSIEDDTPCP